MNYMYLTQNTFFSPFLSLYLPPCPPPSLSPWDSLTHSLTHSLTRSLTLSLSLSFAIKQTKKKFNWSVNYECSITENSFFREITQISVFYWAFQYFLGKMVFFICWTVMPKKKLLYSVESGSLIKYQIPGQKKKLRQPRAGNTGA